MTPMTYKKKGAKADELVVLLGVALVDGKLQGVVMHDPRVQKWQGCPYDKVKLNSLRPLEEDVAAFFGDTPQAPDDGTASREEAEKLRERFDATRDWREQKPTEEDAEEPEVSKVTRS